MYSSDIIIQNFRPQTRWMIIIPFGLLQYYFRSYPDLWNAA